MKNPDEPLTPEQLEVGKRLYQVVKDLYGIACDAHGVNFELPSYVTDADPAGISEEAFDHMLISSISMGVSLLVNAAMQVKQNDPEKLCQSMVAMTAVEFLTLARECYAQAVKEMQTQRNAQC